MRVVICLILLPTLLACAGCGKKKSTSELIGNLKSSDDRDRLIAVRLLADHKDDAAEVVPALIEALQDNEADIRLSAALGLGSFGESARDAVPALQAAQRDHDARVRRAAGTALSRIDPGRFPGSTERKSPP
jgi:hypothetical protein